MLLSETDYILGVHIFYEYILFYIFYQVWEIFAIHFSSTFFYFILFLFL